jgi:hypothetical protein
VSDAREVPHDEGAEASCLGAMMLAADVIEDVTAVISAADFYVPGHATIFDAIVGLYHAGDHVDAQTVASTLRTKGLLEHAGGHSGIARIVASVPATRGAVTYAQTVGRHAHTRRLLGVLAEGTAAAYATEDPAALAERLAEQIEGVDGMPVGLPEDANSMDDWLSEEHPDPPWVIPNIMRRTWRIVVVAAEGSGKSVVTRQIALCAAQGIHPFLHVDCRPVNTLLIDLENPGEAIKETGDRIVAEARTRRGAAYREHGCWIWHRPAGIDLRSRRNQAELDALLAHVKPELVCLGPLYRSFTKKSREDHEGAAEEVQRVLDKMRDRHGFGLILEHHAPKGLGGKRDMVPFGSSLWQRWPDMGLTLERDSDRPGSLRVGQYRGHRVRADWPNRLDRSDRWPWDGWWANGFQDWKSEMF